MKTAKIETRIIGRLDLADAETRDAPLWWHLQGRQYTASGYGVKIPTRTMVKHGGRWKRIFMCIFSNSGTPYVLQGKNWIVCDGEPKKSR